LEIAIIKNKLSLYFHWPYCKSKCPYCDFNSHVNNKIDHNLWANAYLNEIGKHSEQISGKEIRSIFFGGGTPSLMDPSIIEKIIQKILKICTFAQDIEITLEANPTSYEAKKFIEFKSAGINRLSLGIQSLYDQDLKFLGREHSAREAILTINSAAEIFENYSFDLIYTRPNQTVKAWKSELDQALNLAKDHISLYQLTIEKGTKFYSMHKAKEFSMPNDEISYRLYQSTNEIMHQHKFTCYEVSNFARNSKESKHNLCYWNYDDYLGIGPGAHSRVEDSAIYQIYNPDNWLKAALSDAKANQKTEPLSESEMFNEILLMSLRLKDGVKFAKLKEKLGEYNKYLDNKRVSALVDNELLIIDDIGFRATDQGMVKLNKLIEFLTI